jgi:heptosyltransferase-2
MKFLVIQQKMIGDVLASTIICESLKHHFPNAIVHMVANENTLPVLHNNPFIDEVVVFKSEYRNSKRAFYRFLKSLKKTKYQAVIDSYGKLESNLITLFAKADQKIGNRKWYTRWVYTDTVTQVRIPNDKIPLSVSNRLMLLDPIVPNNDFIAYPKLYLTAHELQTAKKNIAELKEFDGQKIIMVGILGSASHKTYPPSYMAKILDIICARCNAKLLFNYIPKQKKEALQIFELCSPKTKKHIEIDFYANSLRDFIGLLSQCDMLIGNEGGAVNMAKALDVPSFCIFSPFIVKGAWHGDVYKNQSSVHLRDYRPELFGKMDKKQIKKNIKELYNAFEPTLFKEEFLDFLAKYCA